MITYDDVYEIGTLGKPHGVKGEIAFRFTDDVFDRTDSNYVFVEVDGLLVPFFFEEYRFRSDSLALVKFCDIESADDAQELNGCHVYFPRSLAEEDDVISWSEIIGYNIIDATTGLIVGKIKGVDDSTINVLFDVERPEGDDVLLPAADELIKDVDRDNKAITLTIPDGLLSNEE